ncbi:MAG: 30S ribosomal protein S20 [Chlamydiae bacterium CG10_big_fil_rev_8_21_14_0_10_42_34]|nr:MAG: 30S ribosomal protein S20 [Chlamydiae bacterium CG10_big_fil_rev_8_21_14_0_10_42_34]
MAEDTAPKAAKKKAVVKVKKPSALKRNLQSEKKRLRNRSYRASVLTSIRAFESSLNQKEAPEAIKTKLNTIYSLMDKGVKKGVYKPQKAARTKARLTARTSK